MNQSEVKTRIAAMSRLIEGVRTAKPRLPRTVQNAELPCMLVEAGHADYSTSLGEKILVEDRDYALTLLVIALTDGNEAKAEEVAEAFVDRIADYFAARPGLQLDTENPPSIAADNSRVMGDESCMPIEYPPQSGNWFMGIRFRLRVRQSRPVRQRQ